MLARCAQCGYENNPYYRFCGMCGVAMPLPATPAESHSVGTPATNGHLTPEPLADDRNRRVDYLLEEQQSDRGHWRMVLALVLLIVSIGLLAWRARREGYPGIALSPAQPAASTSPVPGGDATAPPPSAQHQSETHTAAHTALQPANPEPQPSPSPETQPSNDPGSASSTKPADSDESQQDESHPAMPKQDDVSTPAPAEKPAPEMTKPKSAAPPAPTLSPDDKLVADAQKYLYGNGVPQSCERAQRDLETAARKQNPKAKTLLGTMYATGHCVPRDLPTAYRWYARALRDDPSNPRIERDLELIWKQMTPGEKQVAMRTSQ